MYTMAIKRKGVLTIELSLLMPGILSILILVIYLGIYFHDRCLIEREAYSAALKLSYEEYVSFDEIYIREAFGKRLIGKWDLSTNVDIYDGEISVEVTGKMDSIRGFFGRSVFDALFTTRIVEKSYYLHEPEYLRNNRREKSDYLERYLEYRNCRGE